MTTIDLVGTPVDNTYRYSQQPVAASSVVDCITELSDAGFYQYTLPEELDRAKRVPIESPLGQAYVFGYTNREECIDGENIEESGATPFLKDVHPFAACAQIADTFISEEYVERVYSVTFAETRCTVWDWQEFYDISCFRWIIAEDRAVKLMNKLLEKHGYPERLYYHSSGTNHTEVILVTPPILTVLVKYGAVILNTA